MRCWLPLLIALLLGPLPANAELVTVEFQGTVADVDDDLDLIPPISVGTPFRGSYTYDASTRAEVCGPSTPIAECSRYHFGPDPQVGVEFEVGGYRYSFSNDEDPGRPLRLDVNLNRAPTNPVSNYRVEWARSEAVILDGSPPEVTVDHVSMTIRDAVAPFVITSTALEVPEISEAEGVWFNYTAHWEADPVRVEIYSGIMGPITSLRVVPEPAAGLLLLSAGLMVAGLRKRWP